ncbi:MAG: Methyltransferase, partial [Burkholderiales bacterium]|nr:Methyltransferase [Burkholderiales bacterium]
TAESLAEIRRVSKPGARLGLIWNVRDASVDWVAALEKIVAPHEGAAPRYYDGEWRSAFPAQGFGSFQEKSVTHAHTGSTEQVIVDRIASVSFIAALPEQTRQSVLHQVRALIAATPALAATSDVSMPYVTKMYWCKMVE